MEPAADSSLENDCLGKISRRLIPFMLLLYIVAYLDRINVSFAGAPMAKELGFTDETFGIGAGVFFIGYFLFGVPSNIMVEKLGARRWVAIIMVVWGLISVSMALVKDSFCFYILRFFLGVAEAGFFPGMILYLTYWFPRREHAKAVARFMTAIPLAGVLGGLIASKALLCNFLGLPGWKWLFVITGSPAVLLGFVVLALLPDGPQECKWLTEAQKKWLQEKIYSQRIEPSCKTQEKALLFLNLKVWHLALLYFLLALGMYGFQLWLPQIIKGFGNIDDSHAALLSSVPAIFQAIGMVLIASHSDRKQERKLHVAFSAALAAGGLLLCGFCKDPLLALLCLCFTATGIWGTVGPFWAMPTSYLGPQQAASGIGLINSVGNLGGFAGPYIVGFIKTRSPDIFYSLCALAASLFLAACLALFIKIERSE